MSRSNLTQMTLGSIYQCKNSWLWTYQYSRLYPQRRQHLRPLIVRIALLKFQLNYLVLGLLPKFNVNRDSEVKASARYRCIREKRTLSALFLLIWQNHLANSIIPLVKRSTLLFIPRCHRQDPCSQVSQVKYPGRVIQAHKGGDLL